MVHIDRSGELASLEPIQMYLKRIRNRSLAKMAELFLKLKNLGELNIILSGTVGQFDRDLIGYLEDVADVPVVAKGEKSVNLFLKVHNFDL